jgi:hypothetical protein
VPPVFIVALFFLAVLGLYSLLSLVASFSRRQFQKHTLRPFAASMIQPASPEESMVDSICEEIAEVDNFWFYSYYVAWDNVYQLQIGHKSQTEGLEKKVNEFEEQIKGLGGQINDPETEVNKLKVKVEALDKLLANVKTETDSEKTRSLTALSRETTRHKNELDRVRNTHEWQLDELKEQLDLYMPCPTPPKIGRRWRDLAGIPVPDEAKSKNTDKDEDKDKLDAKHLGPRDDLSNKKDDSDDESDDDDSPGPDPSGERIQSQGGKTSATKTKPAEQANDEEHDGSAEGVQEPPQQPFRPATPPPIPVDDEHEDPYGCTPKHAKKRAIRFPSRHPTTDQFVPKEEALQAVLDRIANGVQQLSIDSSPPPATGASEATPTRPTAPPLTSVDDVFGDGPTPIVSPHSLASFIAAAGQPQFGTPSEQLSTDSSPHSPPPTSSRKYLVLPLNPPSPNPSLKSRRRMLRRKR